MINDRGKSCTLLLWISRCRSCVSRVKWWTLASLKSLHSESSRDRNPVRDSKCMAISPEHSQTSHSVMLVKRFILLKTSPKFMNLVWQLHNQNGVQKQWFPWFTLSPSDSPFLTKLLRHGKSSQRYQIRKPSQEGYHFQSPTFWSFGNYLMALKAGIGVICMQSSKKWQNGFVCYQVWICSLGARNTSAISMKLSIHITFPQKYCKISFILGMS